ncbi:MAG: inositol 2-dehydrogenase [Cyclobacteriaceae bacterium]|nr:inositol 2-dehydrogenase [Cyclobacteriaceae bacterium]
MNKVRIAIIGLGRIGKIHFENMHFHIPEVEVKAVSDPHTRIETYGIPYLSLEEIMKHPEIDAVAICSPTNTHADYIEMAAKAGKHIFCEKPHDLDLARVLQSLQIVEECGVKFMLGFNRRFDPNFLRIRSLVEQGKVGDPLILKITSRDPGPPPVEYIKSSGGLFLDMAIHDFDMARYIMQKEVKEVYSKSAVFVDPAIGEAGDIDTAVTTLTFEDGSMAVIDNCRKAVYGYDQRLEVFGSAGMAKVENNFPDNHSLSDGSGVHSALPLNFFMERYTTSYLNETRMFVKALVEGVEVPASGVDGLQAMKIALAAKKSITENRPVAISEIK